MSRDLFHEYVLSGISLSIGRTIDSFDEKFQNADTSGHLLYLLFKLNELTLGYFSHTLICIGHRPFYQLAQINQIEAELGVLTPITIFVPAYTRTEIANILQMILTRKLFVHRFLRMILTSCRTTDYSSFIHGSIANHHRISSTNLLCCDQ